MEALSEDKTRPPLALPSKETTPRRRKSGWMSSPTSSSMPSSKVGNCHLPPPHHVHHKATVQNSFVPHNISFRQLFSELQSWTNSGCKHPQLHGNNQTKERFSESQGKEKIKKVTRKSRKVSRRKVQIWLHWKRGEKKHKIVPKITYFVTMMATIVPFCYYAVGVWRPLAVGNKKV